MICLAIGLGVLGLAAMRCAAHVAATAEATAGMAAEAGTVIIAAGAGAG